MSQDPFKTKVPEAQPVSNGSAKSSAGASASAAPTASAKDGAASSSSMFSTQVPTSSAGVASPMSTSLGTMRGSDFVRGTHYADENPERSKIARHLNEALKAHVEQYRKEEAKLATLLKEHAPSGSLPVDKLNNFLDEAQKVGGVARTPQDADFVLKACSGPGGPVENLPKMELLLAMGDLYLYQKYRKDIDTVFYLYDEDSTGKIEREEARAVLEDMAGAPLGDEELQMIVSKADIDHDKAINKQEFANMVTVWRTHRGTPTCSVCKTPVCGVCTIS